MDGKDNTDLGMDPAAELAEEALNLYLDITQVPRPEMLEGLEKTARRDGVPIIRRRVQDFLRVLITMKQPGTILEVGTAVGFSALWMLEYAPSDCKLTTLESDENRVQAARENFLAAGFVQKGALEAKEPTGEPQGSDGMLAMNYCREGQEIDFRPGDATATLPLLQGSFDLIFLDAAKGQYPVFLPQLMRLLPPGGVLVTDNALQEGETLLSRFALPHRDRTIHSRMREYLWAICHDDALETTILPIGDGLAISVRK